MKKSEIHDLNKIEKIKVKDLEVIPDNIELYYNYSIHENNKIIKQSEEKRANSFLKQFIQLLDVYILDPVQSITDTSGASISFGTVIPTYGPGWPGSYIFDTYAASSIATYGIQVGIGINAVTINDYVLQTLITHGSTTGKLQYGVMQYGAPAFTSTTGTLRFTRVFGNASGGTITVNEIGLCTRTYYSPGADKYFLIMRDILSPGVAILNGQSMTLNYNMTTTI